MHKYLLRFAFYMILASTSVSSFSTANEVRTSDEVNAINDEITSIVERWLSQPGDLNSITSFIAKENGSEIRPQYIWTIAKRALIWALRNHSDTIVKKLPKKWRGPVGRNAKKLANLIDTLDEWKEGACIVGLASMGIPPSDAQMMCQAISFLL